MKEFIRSRILLPKEDFHHRVKYIQKTKAKCVPKTAPAFRSPRAFSARTRDPNAADPMSSSSSSSSVVSLVLVVVLLPFFFFVMISFGYIFFGTFDYSSLLLLLLFGISVMMDLRRVCVYSYRITTSS